MTEHGVRFGGCSVKSHSKTKHNYGISPYVREATSCGSEALSYVETEGSLLG